jgi:alpha-ketoglutarate-dependent taurine dioxygenase
VGTEGAISRWSGSDDKFGFSDEEEGMFVCEHFWHPNEVLAWEVLQRRTDVTGEQRRLMRRIAINGESPV